MEMTSNTPMMAVLNADLNRRGSQNISKCLQTSAKFKYFSSDLEVTPMMAVLNANLNRRGSLIFLNVLQAPPKNPKF
ncbi:hypothetical protein KFK09_008277 [Dendrobium nobile]|uniref:Uncharacterized protein n=1 Tax=Dendrobium nobile TaxID=94219 RepID=A0A8T3BN75_DENNO|nr:hypothetical protein KFK09_008277 [Dendrobium nobile]